MPQTPDNTAWMTPAIAGGTGILSSLVGNAGAKARQKLANKQNIKFWQMQNAYNDPTEQMARLKKAGLNPNLIYGSSVAGATGQAGAIAPSKAAPYSMDNPAIPALQAMQAKSQEANTNMKTALDAVTLGVDKKFAEPIAKQQLNNITLGNIQQYLQNQQLSPFVATAVERASEQLLTIQANTKSSQAKQSVNEFQAELAKIGINPTGNFGMTLFRMLAAGLPEIQQYLLKPFKN